MEQVVLKVDGMSCQGCVKTVTGVLQGVAGVGSVAVSLEQGTADVSFDPTATDPARLCAVVNDAGFDCA